MPRFFLFVAVAILCAGQVLAAPLESGFALAPSPSASSAEKAVAYKKARECLLAEAGKYEHTPYRYGGIDGRGLDCSGLVYLTFHEALGISVPRNAESLYAWVEKIQIENAQPGDLVFFRTMGDGRVSHVGIYAGGRRFIHSASEGPVTGVMYSSLDERYWSRTYAGAGRALPVSSPDIFDGTGGKGAVAAAAADTKRPDIARKPDNARKPAVEGASAEYREKPGNILLGIAAAPTWNTYFADSYALRGAAWQLRAGVAVKPLGIPMIFGIELRPEWDMSLGVFRVPLTLSWGLNDKLRIFAGPAVSFGDAELRVSGGSRRYTGGTSWIGAAGITVAPYEAKLGDFNLAPYGELAWQSYYSDNNVGNNYGADLAAGIRFSTGIRVTYGNVR
ncbi:MAG: C40 family peptidase [Treponema sp.]|nr:C40 family peptidase [Treponema sp.]